MVRFSRQDGIAPQVKLQFWFEYASTYSYPCAMRIAALAASAGVEVEWRPFLLGPLFYSQQGMNDSPFNVVPIKGAYMWRDLERICARHDIPFTRPTIFPQNGLFAARATLTLPHPQRPAFARRIYTANFAEGRDISDPDTVHACLTSAGADADACLRAAAEGEIKSQLRDDTQHATELGLFGAPSLVAPDGEVFWGNDRLEDALAWTIHGTLRPPQKD